MEASLEKIPSIGFSLLDFNWDANFEPAKEWVHYIMSFVLKKGIPQGNLLNVNIPAKKEQPIQGLKVCKQANSRWVEEYVTGTDPRGQPYYWLTGKFVNEDQNPDTDIKALQAGYISVVPSHHDLTNYQSLPLLKIMEKTVI
jgi:5'-nucleotidase